MVYSYLPHLDFENILMLIFYKFSIISDFPKNNKNLQFCRFLAPTSKTANFAILYHFDLFMKYFFNLNYNLSK